MINILKQIGIILRAHEIKSPISLKLCLFADPFKQYFEKFKNQKTPSVRIFVFRESKFKLTTFLQF